MISTATIDKVREVSVLDIVNRYNDILLKEAGQTYKGLSPFTDEKTPSFFVHAKKNFFKCHSSGKAGNAITFVMLKDKVSFTDAIKIIAGWENIPIEYDNSQPNEPDKKAEIQQLLEWACAHFCANEIPESFTQFRAFPCECLELFKVGYAKSSWDDLLNSAKRAGHSTDLLLMTGLIRHSPNGKLYDAFRDRIMFPIMDFHGNVVAFTARDAETQIPTEGEERSPKYINSPESCYDKSSHLYGLYQAVKGGKINNKNGVYVVEGPTDVIRFHEHAISNTIAPCGSALTEEQVKLLKRFTDKIIFVPDNDCEKEINSGIEAMKRNAIIAIKAGFTVKLLIPGEK